MQSIEKSSHVQKLRDLLERCEKATGPDREINTALFQALIGVDAHDAKRWYGGGYEAHVTESLDASIALVERMLPGWEVDISIMPAGHAGVDMRGPEYCDADMSQYAYSKVLKTPLAILSALLRALISQAEGEGA